MKQGKWLLCFRGNFPKTIWGVPFGTNFSTKDSSLKQKPQIELDVSENSGFSPNHPF